MMLLAELRHWRWVLGFQKPKLGLVSLSCCYLQTWCGLLATPPGPCSSAHRDDDGLTSGIISKSQWNAFLFIRFAIIMVFLHNNGALTKTGLKSCCVRKEAWSNRKNTILVKSKDMTRVNRADAELEAWVQRASVCQKKKEQELWGTWLFQAKQTRSQS